LAKLSALIQLILGLLLAVMFLLGGGVAAALYLAAKHSAQPERPVFEEEKVATNQPTPAAKPSAAPTPQTSATPTESASNPKELEPGAYVARVSWPQGLVLRDSPSYESNTLGGIPFNGRIVVLEETPDKEWQRVRVEGSEDKGWVKGGNTERLAQ
jgi:hypothetical protein